MIGAILGDMIGAPYEFDRGSKTKDFELFGRGVHYTDDTVMTIAVADVLMSAGKAPDDEVKAALITSMQSWGCRYPKAGYGGMFRRWLREKNPKPYGSYGNGSAMRVSSAGWLFDSLEETRHYARLTAEVTHNHPEGIKGAEAAASAIFMARNGYHKEEIRAYITDEFGYDLSRSCDEIRPLYHHVETCQETVPEAFTAFLEGESFEDVIRTAVSLGGDCDTLTCIAGGIAEAFYGIPDRFETECRKRLPDEMLQVLDRFQTLRKDKKRFQDPSLEGNEVIEKAVAAYYLESSRDSLTAVLEAIRTRMYADGHFMVPVIIHDGDAMQAATRVLEVRKGVYYQPVFTSAKEYEKGQSSQIISDRMDDAMKDCLGAEHLEGIIINPWGQPFLLDKSLIGMIFSVDGGMEYTVPSEPITSELLQGGAYLKRAIGICNRNQTTLNLLKTLRILRESTVWIPCNAIFADSDMEELDRQVTEALNGDGLDSMAGREMTAHEPVRFVPDILCSGEEYFFPVFTSEQEMGEYGDQFSKFECDFPYAMMLARNNKKHVAGIVINAFTESFVVDRNLFDIIEGMGPENGQMEDTDE